MKFQISLYPLLLVGLLAAQIKAPVRHSPRSSTAFSYKLIAINVKGTRYKPGDVIAASGLNVGENVTEESFNKASSRLAETGLFTNIAYEYSYSAEGTKLDLELVDSTDLVPVRFENFVWYSDEDLIEKVHEQLGLFEGKVPASGGLNDQVVNVLSGLVSVRNPRLHAIYMQSASSERSEKIDSVVFSVAGVPIRIRKVTYAGNNPSFAVPLADVASKVEGGEYSRSNLRFFAEKDARQVYLQHGYLKAAFGTPEPTVVSEAQDRVLVDVKLPVTEGLQYKLASIQWVGESAVPVDKLQPMIHLPLKQPVNSVQLDEDLADVRKLYGTLGYLKASIAPDSEFNDSGSSVVYTLIVKEGDRYHFGEVDFDGVDDKTKARLREDWHLREGEPYDTSYPATFVKESARDFPPGVHWKIRADESVNEAEKTVDVTITFAADGT